MPQKKILASKLDFLEFIMKRKVILPDEGSLSELWVELYHGGEETGSLHFYTPDDETNLVLIWDCSYSIFKENKRFFEVRE